jgi:hypothetical protein
VTGRFGDPVAVYRMLYTRHGGKITTGMAMITRQHACRPRSRTILRIPYSRDHQSSRIQGSPVWSCLVCMFCISLSYCQAQITIGMDVHVILPALPFVCSILPYGTQSNTLGGWNASARTLHTFKAGCFYVGNAFIQDRRQTNAAMFSSDEIFDGVGRLWN